MTLFGCLAALDLMGDFDTVEKTMRLGLLFFKFEQRGRERFNVYRFLAL
jgi:hypothetical protein